MLCDNSNRLAKTVRELCDAASYNPVYHEDIHDKPMPSVDQLAAIVRQLKSVIFPGFFSDVEMNCGIMEYVTGSTLSSIVPVLTEQIKRGFCFGCESSDVCDTCDTRAENAVYHLIERLPEIRRLLATDARAAYLGDPAAISIGEAIFCYPSVQVMTSHRIAHELYKINIPLIPRIISELAHSATGIDIHPGASIGEGIFIDHGTGTVIGETTVIGKNVRIYQGVTLGARSFPLDQSGNPIKGVKRHPNVEDEVIIYAGATILGDVVIGKGAVIGGNVWLMENVAPGVRIMQNRHEQNQVVSERF